MTPSLDLLTRGWRGPWLAALVALTAVLPGLIALPVTDRAEARLASASAQMLEDRDLTVAPADDPASDQQPLGVHWLQAAGVVLAGEDPEDRRIWAYRLPAAAGAMIAAAACAWGGAALFGPGAGFIAGAVLAGGFLVSTAGVLDAAGALACAGATLAVASLARIRLAATGDLHAGRLTAALLWLGLAMAAIVGLAGPVTIVLTGAALWLTERRAPWLGRLGWGWGLILMAALVGPSLVAGLVVAQGGPPAWPTFGDGERTPGFQLMMSPLLLFPFSLALPAAVVAVRRARRDPAVRIALCWLVPTWIVLEFMPGQRLAGGLLIYGALAWLCAAAVRDGIGPKAAWLGAALQALAAAVLIAGLLYAARRFGAEDALAWAVLCALLLAASALAGGALLLRGNAKTALAVAGAFGVLAHGAALAGAIPRLHALWIGEHAAKALAAAGLDPRDGAVPGPVALAGFDEPSLSFLLGGQAEALSAEEAAAALRTGRPALVEARQEAAFLAALEPGGARKAGQIDGFDYSKGAPVRLMLYAPKPR